MRPTRLKRTLAMVPAAALVATLIPAGPASATFRGDNGKIVWSSSTIPTGPNDVPVGDVYSANPDGSELTNLTPDTDDSAEAYPAVSPDGKTLVFGSDRLSKNDLDPFLLDLETLEVTPLPSTEGDEGWFAWSPDGTKLSWSVDQSGIKVFSLTTGLVSDVVENGWHPNFSPDGSKIVFIQPTGGVNDLYSVNVSGSGLTQLTDSTNDYEFAPNYSPDGTTILYSKSNSDFTVVDLWTMNADGSNEQQLTSLTGWESEPAWSPDGTKIVFTRDSDGFEEAASQDLVTADADGTNVQPLHASALIEDHPDWQALGNGGPSEEPELPEAKPVLGLKLVKHLVAKVTIGGTRCGDGLPIKIQKSVAGKWKTVASGVSTAGLFKKKVADKPGKYRAKSSAYTSSGASCLAAKSGTVAHKHS